MALRRPGRVLVLTKSDPGAGQHRLRAGRHRRRGWRRRLAGAARRRHDRGRRRPVRRSRPSTCSSRTGPRYVRRAASSGARPSIALPDGALDLAREGAHSVRRVLHAHDATGREIGRVLAARLAHAPARRRSSITPPSCKRSSRTARVAGVRFLDARRPARRGARAAATLLATGGAGQVYRETTNPAVATGDGVALAYLAGARVADLEFVQFHPTALAVPGAPRYLLSEALRGEGARLDQRRRRAVHARATSRPATWRRAIAWRARSCASPSGRAAPVYLTLAHLPAATVRARFPLIADASAGASGSIWRPTGCR